MLDSRPCGARMTRLGLGLDSRLDLDSRLRGNDEGVVDSRLCGNGEGVVDSRLCGGGNDGSCGGSCVLATGCEQGGAKNQAQEGYCRLLPIDKPIATVEMIRVFGLTFRSWIF